MISSPRIESSRAGAPTLSIISDIGDPRNPRVWSGTPNNIALSMEKLGCLVTGVDLRPPKAVRGGLKALSIMTGTGPDFRRTWFGRTVKKKLPPNKSDSICLHISSTTIPLDNSHCGSKHVLFTDSTFNLRARQLEQNYRSKVLRVYERSEFKAINAADHIFTTGEHVKRDLLDHYKICSNRVTVVGSGRGKIQASPGNRDYSNKTTLFVAKERFEEKGGALLLNAFRQAIKVDPSLRLIVVSLPQYRGLVESVPGATFKTALPWDELQALFNSVCLFAMPAKYEPWGLVYIEALACRTPVLGLNRNALPEISNYGGAAFLVENDTEEAIADCLLKAFADPVRLRVMGEVGQKHVTQNYTWGRTASKIYAQLFESRTEQCL